MKNIDKFKSRKNWEEYLWETVLENIARLNTKKELKSFLNSLLSEAEKKNISRRLIVFSLLKQGKTYREIGEILWISPGTIRAIKKSLFDKENYKSKRGIYKEGVIKTENLKKMKEIPPETIFDHLAQIKWPRITYMRKIK